MPFDSHSNFGYSVVVSAPAPADSGTSLTVDAGQGALFPAAPFNCSVWPASVQPLASNAEIVRVTAVVGDTLTIVRAQEGTAAVAIAAGFQIANTTSVKVFTDIEADVNTNTADIATLQTSKQDASALLADIANTAFVQGDILYYNGANLVRLAAGAAGQVLETQGAGANPQWVAVGGGGDLLAANNLSDVVSASDSRQNLGLEIGVDVQAFNALLADISGLTLAQGDVLYYNGTNLVNLGPGTSGQFLQTQGAGANPIWATGGGGSDWDIVITKSADQTVTNTTVFTDDNELTTTITNGKWLVQLLLFYNGNNTTGDFKGVIVFPNNGSGAFGTVSGVNASLAAFVTAFSGTGTDFPAAAGINLGVNGDTLTFGATFEFIMLGVAGTLKFQFANVAAAAGRDSTCLAGSTLRLKQLI